MKNILCTICMRSGSKGIRNKNLLKIGKKDLMSFTIKQAANSRLFSNIIVSTDSKRILARAKKHGAAGWFLRPTQLSRDTTGKIIVIKHALLMAEKFFNKTFDYIVDLDVTSPLRKISDIKKSLKLIKRKHGDNLISGSISRRSPYFNMVIVNKNQVRKVLNSKKLIYRRQDAPKTFDLNASIYIWKRKTLLTKKTLFNKKTVFFEMPPERSFDIDNYFDLKVVKSLKKNEK